MNKHTILLPAVLLALAACSNTKSATEADFGNSKASLIKAQAADPARSANPGSDPVTGVDPDYANNVIGAMRETVAKPEAVKEPIAIRIGGENGGN